METRRVSRGMLLLLVVLDGVGSGRSCLSRSGQSPDTLRMPVHTPAKVFVVASVVHGDTGDEGDVMMTS